MSGVVAFSGGVGGAKLALGLARVHQPSKLTIACNTGDDFTHLGLSISPDIDTVLYTLAGLAHPVQGWGRRDESWVFMETLESLGGETWFRLGDRDLALHLYRTPRLAAGATLSEVTAEIARSLGISVAVVPATDDPVRTMIDSHGTRLAFQEYFVRDRCAPVVTGLVYDGIEQARPSSGLAAALAADDLEAIILCPSNPFLSLAPILKIPAIATALAHRTVPAVAVSPVIGGKAVKGPTVKIMAELGLETSALGIARWLAPYVDGLVIDHQDAGLVPAIEALGMRACCAPTLMNTLDDRIALARETLAFARSL